MKKALYLVIVLFYFASIGYAETTEAYHNDKFKFSLNIPAEFKTTPSSAPFSLAAYTNEKVYLQLRYIDPQGNYSGPTFGTITKKELENFIKRQRLVAALNMSKFKFSNYDTHVTTDGFPYVWAMFIANIQINEDNFRTYMLHNYFLNKDVIIELNFIIPEEDFVNSSTIISDIISSFKFDNQPPYNVPFQ
jgi:hypothetical protein